MQHPTLKQLLSDIGRLLISQPAMPGSTPVEYVRNLQSLYPRQPESRDAGWGGRGPGFQAGLMRMSPMLFAFKAKREAMAGEKAAESSGEVSGGLVASR